MMVISSSQCFLAIEMSLLNSFIRSLQWCEILWTAICAGTLAVDESKTVSSVVNLQRQGLLYVNDYSKTSIFLSPYGYCSLKIEFRV